MTTDAGAPGAPRFDVVLRGYDRRQVDEHVARLQRVLARMRADLEMARSQPFPVVNSPSAGLALGQQGPAPGQQGPPGGRPRPTPRPRPGLPPQAESPDMIGSFTDRMQTILQAAEEEAAEIRNKARAESRAEQEQARGYLAELVRQRDIVLAELARMRGQLEGLLAAPTARIALPQSVPPQSAPQQPGRPRDAAGPGQPPGAARSGPNRPGAGGPAPSQPSSGQPSSGQPGSGRSGPGQPGAGQAGPSGRAPAESGPPAPGGPPPEPPQSADRPSLAPTPAGGRPSTAAPLGDPAKASTSSAASPSTPPVEKPAAHRLPSVGEQTASMRPRSEPEPEPGDLFRPASRAAAEQPTTATPVDEPDTATTPVDRKPADVKPGDVEATVKVEAVRPGVPPSEDTVLTPAATPDEGEPERERPAPQADSDSSTGDATDGGKDSGPGANGAVPGDRTDRSTSASRSG